MQGPPVIDNSQDAECEADSEGDGHGVLGIGVHALEDLSGSNDGSDNGAEPWLCKHNVCSPACSFSGSCTRPGHVSSLELERGVTAGNSALASLSPKTSELGRQTTNCLRAAKHGRGFLHSDLPGNYQIKGHLTF